MHKLDLNTLSVVLNKELGSLTISAYKMNKKYKLGIDDMTDMTKKQFEILRAAHDTAFMVLLLGGGSEKADGVKYNYRSSPLWTDLVVWLGEFDLNGFSTADIKATLPSHLNKCAMQTVASAMRDLGYENRRMYEGEGPNRKQARRWHKHRVEPAPSFM